MTTSSPPHVLIGVTVGQSLLHHYGLPQLLRERGWRVTVVSSPSTESKSLLAAGFEVVELPMEREPSPARDILSLGAWVRTLRSFRPDVVLIGTPKASLLGLLAARMCRVPVRIYVLHGLRLETTRGLYRRVLLTIEKLTAACATHVIAVSDSLLSRAQTVGCFTVGKGVVLGSGSINGVAVPNEQSVKSLRSVAPHRVPVIGYVGRIHPDKGFGDFLIAIERLRGAGVKIRTVVVGAPEGAEGNALLDRYQALQGDHQYRGSVDDVGPHYAEMDLLCLPSYREGLGMVVLEAASWGVPAVVSDATGVRDAVVDGLTGWRFPTGDTGALTKIVVRALSDRAALESAGTQARLRVQASFSRGMVQERLVRFLEGTVKS